MEDPEGFKSLSDLVFAGLKESTGHTRSYLISEEINRILEKDKKRFEEKSEETRRAIAEEEIVARACEDRLANSRLAKEFIAEMENKESGLTQKFSNFLGEAIARLKKLFQQIFSTLSRTKEAQSLRKLTDSLEAIQSQYDALLERRTTEATTAPSAQQKNTSDRGVMNAERYAKTKTNIKILSLIEKIEEGNFKANDKVYFGNVSDSLAKKIYDLTNINVYGFKVAIEARQLEHILKDHGKQGLTDRSMSDYSNIAKIEYVLEEPDSIVPAGKTKAYTNMIDGKNKTANTILYEKNIGEKSYYVVQAVPDTKAKTLYVVTAFIGKTGYKKEATQLINANRLDATAKTESVRASKNSISNSSPSVNPQNSETDKGAMKSERMVVTSEHKQQQLEIINATNPAPNSYSTWIRSVGDIKTLAETLEDSDWEDEVINPDLTRSDIQSAIKTGTITVYSSYPIENGVFVSPSRMEAESYSGDGKVYEKTVNVSDVAWIDPTQGQYAKVDSKGSMKADRATYMTARELLLQAMADEELKKSEIYSPLLREYTARIDELDKKYLALEAAEHDYVASIDAFDSEEKQARYKYNMDKLAREISRIERDLTKQEESPELKRLVLREKEATRKQTEKEARQDTASRMSNYRKSIERKSTLERIEAKATCKFPLDEEIHRGNGAEGIGLNAEILKFSGRSHCPSEKALSADLFHPFPHQGSTVPT